MSVPTYRVRDWDLHFETSDSRRRKHALTWIGIPTKHDGRGFNRLRRQSDWPALYGAWVLIVAIAAKCPARGVLADQDGPFTAIDIADKVGLPDDLVQRCLDVLTSPELGVNWLEITADAQQTCSTSTADLQQASADLPPTRPDLTLPDQIPERVSESGSEEKPPAKPSKSKSSVFDWITEKDLHDVGKLIAWHKRAAKCPNPVIGPTEADRLNVVAAAVKSWDKADNPKALFVWIVSKQRWDFISELDETTAHDLIRDYLRGGSKPRRQNGDCKSAAESMPDLLAGLGVKP